MSSNDFVLSSYDGTVINTEDIFQSLETSGIFGGIYVSNQKVQNSGNITLTGSNAFGIMSCAEGSENCLSAKISATGENIANSGSIKITGDSSYGIYATTLGTLENSTLTKLNTIENNGMTAAVILASSFTETAI